MKKIQYSSPTSLDGRLPLRTAGPLGLQHVLAMFVGNLSPLLALMAVMFERLEKKTSKPA